MRCDFSKNMRSTLGVQLGMNRTANTEMLKLDVWLSRMAKSFLCVFHNYRRIECVLYYSRESSMSLQNNTIYIYKRYIEIVRSKWFGMCWPNGNRCRFHITTSFGQRYLCTMTAHSLYTQSN